MAAALSRKHLSSILLLLLVIITISFTKAFTIPTPLQATIRKTTTTTTIRMSTQASSTSTSTTDACCSSSNKKETTAAAATTAATTTTSLFVDETSTATKRAEVQDYYGKTLQTSDDLKTNACCTAGSPPKHIQDAIANLHPTTVMKYYGCGLCLPSYDLTGANILDLGCGAGRDVYIASQLVGPTGRVVGVDMTTEQLNTAREFQSYHTEKFGYNNVEFIQGYLESLADIKELQKESFDVIISNCVINLCTNKAAVLKACYNLLKPGGELYFSDVYTNRRVPTMLQQDQILWGECLSGALYWNDFINLAKYAGFLDPRLVEDSPITISNKKVQASVHDSGHAGLEFYSATYRLIKLDSSMLEPACEDYGQAVIYKGTIPLHASTWTLDKHHVFEQGRIHPVCGNTWYMLQQNPRVASHFTFIGDFSTHYGIFEGCGSSLPYDKQSTTSSGSKGGGGGGGCC